MGKSHRSQACDQGLLRRLALHSCIWAVASSIPFFSSRPQGSCRSKRDLRIPPLKQGLTIIGICNASAMPKITSPSGADEPGSVAATRAVGLALPAMTVIGPPLVSALHAAASAFRCGIRTVSRDPLRGAHLADRRRLRGCRAWSAPYRPCQRVLMDVYVQILFYKVAESRAVDQLDSMFCSALIQHPAVNHDVVTRMPGPRLSHPWRQPAHGCDTNGQVPLGLDDRAAHQPAGLG
jgi:hypothetical protein